MMPRIVKAEIDDISERRTISFRALDNSAARAFEVFFELFTPARLILTLSDNRQVIINKPQGPTGLIDIDIKSKPEAGIGLKVLSPSELKATPNKFRAVILIDSEPYQIGEDVNSLRAAKLLCGLVQESPGQFLAVYDDQGHQLLG